MQEQIGIAIAWILVVIATESVTELLVDSAIFYPVRDRISRINDRLATFINCGQCTSVWVAAFFSIFIPKNITDYLIINFIIAVFVVQRLSNVFHHLIHREGELIDTEGQ